MEFSTLLAALASELKLQNLEANSEGRCALEIDGMPVNICCVPEGNAVVLVAEVGDVSAQDAEGLQDLLAANLAFANGMQLGVDADNRVLLMHWSPLQNLEFDGFVHSLEEFVNGLSYWIDRLSSAAPARSAAAAMMAAM